MIRDVWSPRFSSCALSRVVAGPPFSILHPHTPDNYSVPAQNTTWVPVVANLTVLSVRWHSYRQAPDERFPDNRRLVTF